MSVEYDDALEICRKLEQHRKRHTQAPLGPANRRERIATAAMQGLLGTKWFQDAVNTNPDAYSFLTDNAVVIADALIARLDGKSPK